MNRKSIFFIISTLIWIFFLIKIGLNIFGVLFALFFNAMWCAAFVGWIKGGNQFKRDQYFANKYDEEYKEN